MDEIRKLLSANDETTMWLERLEAIGAPDFEVVLPSADDLPIVLLELAVPHEDIRDLVAMRLTRERSPELWWLLERCAHTLVREMGMIDGLEGFPDLSTSLGTLQRYFYIYVFLAVLPHVRAFHRARGIPDDVSWLTLTDLGRNMAVHRMRHGVGGLDTVFWLKLHFRGAIYGLGRLQFERTTLGTRTGQAMLAAGMAYGPGTPSLAIHIPEFLGPMTPHACDASFERAKEFYARYFPEEPYAIATCHSWLLDQQLQEYLPENSNIVQFQKRFQIGSRPDNNDEGIIRFVFGRVDNPSLDELPQDTVLERAIISHIKAGRHWHGGGGFLTL